MQNMIGLIAAYFAAGIGEMASVGADAALRVSMDLLRREDPLAITYLCGWMVLIPSALRYALGLVKKDREIRPGLALPLALGAAAGGVLGRRLLLDTAAMLNSSRLTGAVQVGVLLLVLVATLIYLVRESSIRPRNLNQNWSGALVGLVLGTLSGFLGMAGGPAGLAMLRYFYGMETDKASNRAMLAAAAGQTGALACTLALGAAPAIPAATLRLMVLFAAVGTLSGRSVAKNMKPLVAGKFFEDMMGLLVLLSVFNAARYAFL